MESRAGEITSDAEWYCMKDHEEERFYEVFSRCAKSTV